MLQFQPPFDKSAYYKAKATNNKAKPTLGSSKLVRHPYAILAGKEKTQSFANVEVDIVDECPPVEKLLWEGPDLPVIEKMGSMQPNSIPRQVTPEIANYQGT